MHLTFDRPAWLVVLVALVPAAWLAWRAIPHLGRARAISAGVVRALVVLLLAAGLARPSIVRTGEGTSVVVVSDASRSVPPLLRQSAQAWLARRASDRPDPRDRVGSITFGRAAEIQWVPSASAPVEAVRFGGDPVGSDLAAGLRTALALLPPDTVNRILLVSDGVETSGSALEAADRAAALGVPVDVVPIVRPPAADVMVEALRTPARARRGQVIEARVVVRSTAAAKGRLLLRLDGRLVDLDPRGPSDAMRVNLVPGPNAFAVPLPMDRSGAVRVEAVFEPDDPAQVAVAENDLGASITLVSGEGRVLVVGEPGAVDPIEQAIRAARLDVEVIPAEALATRVQAGDFDACVLVDVPRWKIDADTDRALAASVHDLGCGLMMVGGQHAFGAGLWNDSEVARALPVEMSPPQERKLPMGALALVIDCSGSMSSPVAGTSSSQQEIACEAAIRAIRGLSPRDEVSVIAFAGTSEVVVPLTRAGDMAAIESRVRAIEASGGTNMYPALEDALEQLSRSPARTRHVIALTDGQTAGDPAEGFRIAAEMARQGITLSTVAIGDGSNGGLLARLANAANGTYYSVRDDQSRVQLPQIFIKEAQMLRRSSVWEGESMEVARASSAEWMRGLAQLPPIRGYVIAGTRPEPAQTGLVTASDPPDPILAGWNHGLGRAIACTTDLGGRWSSAWSASPGYQPFVAGLVRWILRPTAPPDLALRTRLDGDEAVVELEAAGDAAGAAQAADARVLQPDARSAPLAMRQVGPGRWTGRFAVDRSGAYLVSAAVTMAGQDRPMLTQASVSVPFPREFRSVDADLPRLESIARRTGGRVLKVGDPSVNLFLAEGLPVPESMRQAWDLCVYLAAALFVIDVAVRRLSIEWPVRRPAEAPRDAARVTAAWKQARRTARGGPIAQPVAEPTRAPAPAGGVTAVIDPPAEPPSPPAMPEPEPPPDDSPMGRLRAAKRRARGAGA